MLTRLLSSSFGGVTLAAGLAALLAFALPAVPAAMAADHAAADAASQDMQDTTRDRVTAETDAQLSEKRTKLIQEAVDAIAETRKAIAAIEKGDTDAALAALAVATGKLETVVARDPELALAPVAVDYVTYDVIGTLDDIRETGELVEELVDNGKYQEARAILRDFASEIVIRTTSLPLATYPDAILEATALLDAGKREEALSVLNAALATQVVTETVIPLPPLRAQAMIEVAGILLEKAKGEAEAEHRAKAQELVAAAREQLKRAEALGYGNEEDFAPLHKELKTLAKRIEDKGETAGLLKTIEAEFKALRKRIRDRLFADAFQP